MVFQVKENYRSELKSIDWDFTGTNGDHGFAAYHWYPARYVPQLPGILINYFSNPGQIVLDPFCGSGTTLVEAYKSGRRSIGIDLHPVAALMAQSKLVPFDEASFDSFCSVILSATQARLTQWLSMGSIDYLTTLCPNYDDNKQWYHPDTLRELSIIWHVMCDYKEAPYSSVGLAAFSAILRGCCSQDKHWGWICDNVKPANLIYKNAVQRFQEKLAHYALSARRFQEDIKVLQETPLDVGSAQIFQGDCRKVLQIMEANSVDLIVTSPPYYNMTDYIYSQRLSLLWFEAQTSELRPQEIGARFKRSRKESLSNYLTDMRDAFANMHKVLKPGRFCCVVIGESPKHDPFLNRLESNWEDIGFIQEDCLSRKVAQKRSLSPVLIEEKIYILTKAS